MGNSQPRKWKYVPIKELYHGLYDGPHATPAPSNSGPVFLGIKNISEDGSIDLSDIRHIAEEDFPRWTKRVMPQYGDIVFSYEATLHRYALIPAGFRGCLGRRMALIRVNPNRCDHKFLFFYLRSSLWRQVIESKQVIGATVDRIPLIKFPDFPVLAPDLAAQKKIASVLSAYDDLIENNKRRIAILEKMAEEIYREWFVRMRFSVPSTNGKRLTSPRLQNVALGDVFDFLEGPGIRNWQYTSDGVRFMNIRLIQDGDIEVENANYVSESEAYGKYSHFLLSAGDFVLSTSGTLGRGAIVEPWHLPLMLNTSVIRFRPKNERDYYFMYLHLQSELFIRQQETYASGAAQQNFGPSHLKLMRLALPSRDVLDRFSERVAPIFALTSSLRASNRLLVKTRDLLLPRLISGKLSVENLELPSNESASTISSALPQAELAHA